MNPKSRQRIRHRSSPIALFLFLLALLGAFGSNSHKVEAAGTPITPASTVVSSGGTGISFSMGEYPQNTTPYKPSFTNVTIFGCPSSCNGTIISSSTTYTVIGISLVTNNLGMVDSPSVLCNGVPYPLSGFYSFLSPSGLGGYSSYEIEGYFPCTGNLTYTTSSVAGASLQFTVAYVPYDIMQTMPLSDTHFVLIAEIVIAFWGLIFVVSLFKKKI